LHFIRCAPLSLIRSAHVSGAARPNLRLCISGHPSPNTPARITICFSWIKTNGALGRRYCGRRDTLLSGAALSVISEVDN
jgi:hypothetical protein